MAHQVDPDRPAPPITLAGDELKERRRSHPMNAAMPVIRRLLVDSAVDAGVIVAIADADAQLLWVEGDPNLRRKAEAIHVVSGAAWSEGVAGTNAFGTAQATRDLVQIFGSEHFTRTVHPWSCTAAPVRDPRSGEICGFIDITGRDDVASPQSALLIRSVIAAVEAELRLQWTQEALPSQLSQLSQHSPPAAHTQQLPFARTAQPTAHHLPAFHLRTLGRDRGEFTFNGKTRELSLRHTELLLLLSIHPDGLSASELAWKMYEQDAAEVTVRAEMSRLRKAWPMLVAPTSPYRLLARPQLDAAAVADCLQRGAHRRAVDLYRGQVLPRSEAPGVVEYRSHLHGWLRESLLRHAAADVVLRYLRSPVGRDDLELWQACLDRLPYGSRSRDEVTAAVKSFDDAFAITPAGLRRNADATLRAVRSAGDRVGRPGDSRPRPPGCSDGGSGPWRVEYM